MKVKELIEQLLMYGEEYQEEMILNSNLDEVFDVKYTKGLGVVIRSKKDSEEVCGNYYCDIDRCIYDHHKKW